MNQLDNDAPIINQEELLYAIAFSMLPILGDVRKNKILQYYQSASNIYKYRKDDKASWPLREAEAELKFVDNHAIQCFSILDKYYPNRLGQILDAPSLLYLKGADHFNLPQLISIIGTRQHTHQVKKVIHELLEGLNHLKIGVISGLALGVDGIAHEAALHFNMPTWGVLAHGLDKIYPNQHRQLAINMLQNNGGLITECRQNTITMPFQFPRRNRIVAGMSDATIVIESAIEGGSMITAKLARGYDREVFAVPGKIHDAKSKGCLWLIRDHIATMYHDPIQLLENMNWQAKEIVEVQNTDTPIPFSLASNLSLNPIEQSIYLLIQTQGPIHKDAISIKMGMASGILAIHLVDLELNGLIHLQAGNQYSVT
jgi:DNA processing protein